MIWIIIGIVIFIAFVWITIDDAKNGIQPGIANNLLTLLVIFTFIFLMVLAMNNLFIETGLSKEAKVYKTQYMYALEDNFAVEGYGSFYVSIDTEHRYYFMKRNADETYSVEEISGAKIVKVKENNEEIPRVEYYAKEREHYFLSVLPPSEFTDYEYAIITVPEGSVSTQYNVDIK